MAVISVTLAGCAEFPGVGPNAKDIIAQGAGKPQDPYAVVPVTPVVLQQLSATPHSGFTQIFANHAPVANQMLGIGDVVSITIWDMAGLFGPAGGQPAQPQPTGTGSTTGSTPTSPGTTIPPQTIDQGGFITVPYAGRVRAVGMTTTKLQEIIRDSLKSITYQPQVLVTVSQNQSNLVTVAGDAAHPGRLALPLNGMRILDAIALSGGTNAPSSDMTIRLTRKGVTRSARLDEVVRFPEENIFLESGDLLYLDRAPQSVVILGATNHNAQVAFGKSELNLAEAVGNGGGLTDVQADPYGVFVFRLEPEPVVHALGLRSLAPANQSGLMPVVYQVNMQRPEGFFMAQAFPMRDHDLVYVANSDAVQLSKMFRLFALISTIPKSGSVVSQ